ncbi:DUF2254 domain-containing protein [uncultured Sulfitobacter sp.]|uniref:DUF2254 domain-containing protein n=1 Tax=uncultured Sulfitobacter sp. TaxID=191468 RepID=UPI002613AA55|nr:DUF2254 domain-containing protein [uncultured Sulfitobacter sp.]
MEFIYNLFSSIPTTVLRKARQYTRKLWVRVLLMGLLAIVAVGISQLIEFLIPDELAQSVGGSSADRLLNVIASAMLSVTIFSITVMVSVYQSSSTQWTPRIHRLIMQDRVTQNTLAVFIGAYVYALLGIMLRELGTYKDEHAFVLFWMTVLVLVVIVVYLIRWVLHLQGFGQLIDITRQIEQVTRDQFKERLSLPCLGAIPLTGDVPEDCRPLRAWQSGYIQHIYPEALNALAEEYETDLYLTENIGSFVFLDAPVLHVVQKGADLDWDALCEEVRGCLILGDLRTYDQDPRFGLIVMGEVGSKALSPGVNDPGTAIDVITRIGRILSDYKDETETTPDEKLEHIHVRPLDPADLLRDGFGALSRDGAGSLEVQQRLQQTLSGLMQHPDEGLRIAARKMAKNELQRAFQALSFEPDRAALRLSADDSVELD